MRLIDYLQRALSPRSGHHQLADGSGDRRLAYPELPECTAKSTVVEDAICQLERRRIEMIVRMVGDGCAPPVPRPPLRDCDPAWVARQVGVSPQLIELIDRCDATTVPEQETNFWILR